MIHLYLHLHTQLHQQWGTIDTDALHCLYFSILDSIFLKIDFLNIEDFFQGRGVNILPGQSRTTLCNLFTRPPAGEHLPGTELLFCLLSMAIKLPNCRMFVFLSLTEKCGILRNPL